MRPEDLNEVLAKALEEYGETTDEERERFALLRDRMRHHSEEMARNIEAAKQSNQQLARNSHRVIEIARRREEIAEEIVSELTRAFSEHSDLMERIAAR